MYGRLMTGLVLGAVLALAGPADAKPKENNKTTCGENQSTRLESKDCPGGQVVQRACCTKTSGKERCKSFPKCPKPTPS